MIVFSVISLADIPKTRSFIFQCYLLAVICAI